MAGLQVLQRAAHEVSVRLRIASALCASSVALSVRSCAAFGHV